MRNQRKIQTPKQRDALKPRSTIYWNTISPNHAIGVRRYIHGVAWCARNGSTKTFPDTAHLSYQEALAMVTAYWEQESAIAGSYTVAQAVKDYCKDLRVRKSMNAEVAARRTLDKHLATFMNREVATLTQAELADWQATLVRGGDAETVRKSKATANRILASTKACFNLAYRRGKVTQKPWEHIQAYPSVDACRELLLTSEEVQRLVDTADGWMAPLVRFLSETGARIGEVRNADRQDVDFSTGMISLSGKTGFRRVALRSETLSWLVELPGGIDGSLIPGPTGRRFKPGEHSRGFQRIVTEARVDPSAVVYSLRHAFLSRCVSSGINALPLAKYCGTSATMLEKVYFHQNEATQHAMIDAVSL